MEGIVCTGFKSTIPEDVDYVGVCEDFLGSAKHIIEQGQSLFPLFLLFKKRELTAFLIPMEDDQNKDNVVMTLRNLVREKGIETVAIIMEAWTCTIPKEKLDSTGTSPRDDPDRQESIAMTIQSIDGHKELWNIPFIRIGQEVIFEEPNKTDEVEGKFANFFI